MPEAMNENIYTLNLNIIFSCNYKLIFKYSFNRDLLTAETRQPLSGWFCQSSGRLKKIRRTAMIKETIEDGILIAKFDNPKTNSITFQTLLDIRSALKKVNEDDSIKGMIFTGEGKFFSSGFDLTTFLKFETGDDILEFFNIEEEMLYEVFTCKKPVISAMNGHTTAGGLITSMGCDYRIAKNHPKIKIGMTEIKIGLGLTIAEMELMRFGLDSNKSLRNVMYFGETVDVNTALERGIIDEIAEEDNLIPRAKELICLWMDQPGKAFLSLKEGLRGPRARELRNMLDTIDWQNPLIECLLNPEARKTLDVINKMMGN